MEDGREGATGAAVRAMWGFPGVVLEFPAGGWLRQLLGAIGGEYWCASREGGVEGGGSSGGGFTGVEGATEVAVAVGEEPGADGEGDGG